MGKVIGYARVSTSRQNIERQVRNIKASFPEAVIVKEVYTGTKFQGRKELEKVLKAVKAGDTIVFDSVSRMSRNAAEGFALYEDLYNKEVNLVFLKEPHINTETYRKAMKNQVSLTGDAVDYILEGINRYLMALAQEQIKIAFDQAEKEVMDLRQRTKEGMETARINGKQIGQKEGRKLETKKSIRAKQDIKMLNRSFNGTLDDKETIRLVGISRNTFYKYKKELFIEGLKISKSN